MTESLEISSAPAEAGFSRADFGRARAFVPPPALESRLQAWGKVVGHRAGIMARPKGKKMRQGAFHVGRELMPSPLDLAKDWRMTERLRGHWPSGDEKGGNGGRRGAPSDCRSIQAAYWDIDAAIMGRVVLVHDGEDPYGKPLQRPKMHCIKGKWTPQREGWASVKVQTVLTWLYAVPHYTGEETSIDSLVGARWGHLSYEAQLSWSREYETSLMLWQKSACRLIGIHLPKDPLDLEQLVPMVMGNYYSALRVCPKCFDAIHGSIRPGLRCSLERLPERNVLYDRGLLVLIRDRGGFCVCR